MAEDRFPRAISWALLSFSLLIRLLVLEVNLHHPYPVLLEPGSIDYGMGADPLSHGRALSDLRGSPSMLRPDRPASGDQPGPRGARQKDGRERCGRRSCSFLDLISPGLLSPIGTRRATAERDLSQPSELDRGSNHNVPGASI
jgi:hypothetical protein